MNELQIGKRYKFYACTSNGHGISKIRTGLLESFDNEFAFIRDNNNCLWRIFIEQLLRNK